MHLRPTTQLYDLRRRCSQSVSSLFSELDSYVAFWVFLLLGAGSSSILALELLDNNGPDPLTLSHSAVHLLICLIGLFAPRLGAKLLTVALILGVLLYPISVWSRPLHELTLGPALAVLVVVFARGSLRIIMLTVVFSAPLYRILVYWHSIEVELYVRLVLSMLVSAFIVHRYLDLKQQSEIVSKKRIAEFERVKNQSEKLIADLSDQQKITQSLLVENNFLSGLTGLVSWKLDVQAQTLSYTSGFAKRWKLDLGGTIDFPSYLKLGSPESAAKIESAVSKVCLHKEKVEVTLHDTVHHPGKWHLLRFEPLFDEDNELTHILVLNTDITSLKQTELRLEGALCATQQSEKSSRERAVALDQALATLRSITKAIDLDYFIYELNTAQVTCDPRLGDRLNLKIGEPIKWVEFCKHMQPELRTTLYNLISRSARANEIQTTIYKHTKGPLIGETRKYQCIPDDQTSPFRKVTVVSSDITDLIRMHAEADRASEAISAANAELELSQKKRNQLFGMVAHELRTPVAAIIMMASDSAGEDFAQFKGDILSASRDLLNTIDDMRMLVNPNVKRPIRGESFTVQELVDEVSRNVASIVAATGMRFKQSIALPMIAFEMQFRSDRYRIRHALSNLIKNACLHSQGSQVSLISRIHQEPQGNRFLQWVVIDDGLGIPESMIEKVFGLGERGASEADGTGYGLYITKTWIEELGGKVEYRQRTPYSKGSEFRVSVPLVANSKKINVPQPACLTEDQAVIFQSLNVLMVEDEAMLRMLGQKLLSSFVKFVDVAENGVQGLERLNDTVDIVFSDYFMPQMSGPEMISRMRANGFSGPVIGVTAATIGDQVEELKSAGADIVIAKPLTKESLITLFNEIDRAGLLLRPVYSEGRSE